MRLQRRAFLNALLASAGWPAVAGRAAAAPKKSTRFVFHVSRAASGPFDQIYAPIIAELEKRGFPSMLVHSSVEGSNTPNEDRAAAVLNALRGVKDPVAIVGVSNEGSFLPLVAAARPVRRLVYVNATIPRPGRAFIEACQTEQVAVPGSYLDGLLKAAQGVSDDFLRLIHDPNATKEQLKAMQVRINATPSAHVMVGFYEVCPLKALPKVDNVCVSGAADDQIRPEWEQSTARRLLGVEPVIISGAGHADIYTTRPAEFADTCVQGL